ncbi:MAG: DUF4253 domain-containing protein [Myxococcota bacterium]|nr:DUF4253 domain-containing protein [Myxococcota bacterium]
MKGNVEPISGAVLADDDPVGVTARAVLEAEGVEVSRIVTLLERDGTRIDGVVVHGSVAVDAWKALRAARDRSGRHPVIVGDEAALESLREVCADEAAAVPGEVLRRAAAIDPVAALGEHRAQHLDESGAEVPHEEWDEEDERITEERAAEMRFSAGRDVLSGEPLPEVAIALLPTRDGWEAAAWLGFGGWNECPPPEEHVALLRRWYERWGAEVVSMGRDVIEAHVEAPPKSVGEARALAEEHYAYAPDIVDQGTGSIERLTASLVASQVWFFWWD